MNVGRVVKPRKILLSSMRVIDCCDSCVCVLIMGHSTAPLRVVLERFGFINWYQRDSGFV